jgi:hypothetical protein
MTTINPPSDAAPSARPAGGARLRPLRARWDRLDGRVRLILVVFGLVLLCGAIQFIFLTARTQWSTQTVAGTPPICGTWQITSGTLKGPDPLAEFQLGGIAAPAHDDVWVVGNSVTGDGAPDTPDETPLTLFAHWNGSGWEGMPGNERSSPEIYQLRSGTGGLYIHLNTALALAKDNVWALGESTRGSLAVHWDGQAWSMVPSANAGSSGYRTYLYDSVAVDTNDLWAAGSSYDHHTPFIVHSTGQDWAAMYHYTTPATVTVELLGITAAGKDNLWAVGYNDTRTLVMRPVGDDWTVVPSPNRCGGHNVLRGVAAAAADDVWAVGGCKEDANTVDAPYQPLITHWDGTAWTLVPVPAAVDALPDALLTDVTALAPDNAWAVGSYQDGALLLHWDGSAWTGSTLPSPDPAQAFTAGHLAAVSPDTIWLVGGLGAPNQPPTTGIAARFRPAACAGP